MSKLSNEILHAVSRDDIASLSSTEQNQYYKYRCDILGIDVATKPFDWLTQKGKMRLYANKSCAAQLVEKHGISFTKLERDKEDNLFICTVYGQDKHGRTDVNIGAVPQTSEDMTPENLWMKAATKAKRRLVLGLCGLGELDETEKDSIAVPEAADDPMAKVGDRAKRFSDAHNKGKEEAPTTEDQEDLDKHLESLPGEATIPMPARTEEPAKPKDTSAPKTKGLFEKAQKEVAQQEANEHERAEALVSQIENDLLDIFPECKTPTHLKEAMPGIFKKYKDTVDGFSPQAKGFINQQVLKLKGEFIRKAEEDHA